MVGERKSPVVASLSSARSCAIERKGRGGESADAWARAVSRTARAQDEPLAGARRGGGGAGPRAVGPGWSGGALEQARSASRGVGSRGEKERERVAIPGLGRERRPMRGEGKRAG